MPRPNVRNLTNPPDHWTAFEAEAEREGLSLSRWLGQLAIKALPKKVAVKLSEPRPEGRPKRNVA